MNPNLFESAEFYKRRYGSFSVYLIIPMVSLLGFCILFSLVNYKEITVQSVGELAPANRLEKFSQPVIRACLKITCLITNGLKRVSL